MDILSWLSARAVEPSTWAGIAAITGAFGVDPTIIGSSQAIVMAVAGAAAVVLPEAKKLIAAVQALQAKK